MKIVKLEPSDHLKPFIRHYLYIEAELEGTFKAIPNADIELYFSFCPFKIHTKDYDLEFPKIYVAGIHELSLDAYTCNIGPGIKTAFIVIFKPSGFRILFRISPGDLKNGAYNYDLLFNNGFRDVWELMEKNKEPAKMKVLAENLLSKYLPGKIKCNRAIDYVDDYIRKQNGMLITRQISCLFSTTPRKLQRDFLEFLGHNPKELLNIHRFNFVMNHLNQFTDKSLTEIAYLCGYYDQSHFIKDFRKVTGCTPKSIINHSGSTAYAIANRHYFKSKKL